MAISGRPIAVELETRAQSAWTDGQRIVVTDLTEARREIMVQAALLSAGSLHPSVVRALRGRPAVARRYLSLEGRRALCALSAWLPPAAVPDAGPLPKGSALPANPEDALKLAKKPGVPPPPPWFGTIRPFRLVKSETTRVLEQKGLRQLLLDTELAEPDDEESTASSDDSDPAGASRAMQVIRRILGSDESTMSGEGSAGGHGRPRTARTRGRGREGLLVNVKAGTSKARSLTVTGKSSYPEWNDESGQYRPDWTSVIEMAPVLHSIRTLERPTRHERLRRELAPLGLGMQRRRREPFGSDVDVDAAVRHHVALRCGSTPTEDVYVDNARLRRELSVLILLDASSSGNDPGVSDLTVHAHQVAACAALLDTLSILGDRAAAHAFQSFGRTQVNFTVIKGFDEQFGGRVVARLGAVEPMGYTRLGAAIRHGAALLGRDKTGSRRLLVLISDGFPYDDGYEGRYADADVRHALDEARVSGVGCACLSVGSTHESTGIAATYGENVYAAGDDIDALAPFMQRIFYSALAGARYTDSGRPGSQHDR